MDYHNLSSSTISRVGYDLETQAMQITFVNGRTYDLSGVPPDLADGLVASDSPGRYFNMYLKGRY